LGCLRFLRNRGKSKKKKNFWSWPSAGGGLCKVTDNSFLVVFELFLTKFGFLGRDFGLALLRLVSLFLLDLLGLHMALREPYLSAFEVGPCEIELNSVNFPLAEVSDESGSESGGLRFGQFGLPISSK
jgi:hypothetical protein